MRVVVAAVALAAALCGCGGVDHHPQLARGLSVAPRSVADQLWNKWGLGDNDAVACCHR